LLIFHTGGKEIKTLVYKNPSQAPLLIDKDHDGDLEVLTVAFEREPFHQDQNFFLA
jgi:hypothetical protein